MRKAFLNIKTQLINLAIVVVSLTVMGCKSAETIVTTPDAKEPLLLYRKSPCYGPCPAYEALIYNNGEVRFVPFKHTTVIDTVTFQLSHKELKALQTGISKLDYSHLQKLYKTNWTDMPATHLYFYEAGKEVKHIKHQEGGPEALVQFIKDVHEMLWKYQNGSQK